MSKLTMLKSNLRTKFERIGEEDGTALPRDASNSDRLMHDLFISTDAQAYWKSRFEDAKSAVTQTDVKLIERTVSQVIDDDAGTSVTLLEGKYYTASLDVSKPASRLDAKKLKAKLLTDFDLDALEVDALFDECTSTNAPAKKIKVTMR